MKEKTPAGPHKQPRCGGAQSVTVPVFFHEPVQGRFGGFHYIDEVFSAFYRHVFIFENLEYRPARDFTPLMPSHAVRDGIDLCLFERRDTSHSLLVRLGDDDIIQEQTVFIVLSDLTDISDIAGFHSHSYTLPDSYVSLTIYQVYSISAVGYG